MAMLFRIFVKSAAILLLSAVVSQAQTAQKPIDSDSTDIRVLEERVKNMGEKIADNKAEIKDELDDKFQELNTRMYIYIGFVVAIIAFIGFFLNFFGKKTIRSWVDEKINEIAKEQLDHRLEPIYIKYKDERTKELEERWESRLKEIEEKWIDYEQSMKKAMAKIEKEKALKSITDISTEEFEEFIEKLEKVKEEKEYSASDWFIKALNEDEKGNHKTAIEYYRKAIAKNPKDAQAYNNRGFSYNKLNELKEAIRDFNKAIELDPENSIFYNNRGLTYRKLKEYKKALDEYNKAIELSPKYAAAFNNRGFVYHNLREYKKAINDYNKAIELAPNVYESLNNLATTQMILGKYADALRSIEKGLTLDLDREASAILYYKKCIITKLLGLDTTESEKTFTAALEGEFVLEMSFHVITDWLSEADLPPDTKRFIEEKTEMLRKKIK